MISPMVNVCGLDGHPAVTRTIALFRPQYRVEFRTDVNIQVNLLMNHQGNLHDMIQVRGSGNKRLQVKHNDMA
jgi:hypothetical protein